MASQGDQQETKEDAIIRVISFRRENHNEQIIKFDAKLLLDWQSSMIWSAAIAGPISGLGAMQNLPVEVINLILKELDIESCLNFRKVSRVARNIVANTLEYRRIATHAPTCLLAMLRTGVAHSYTFPDLYRAMLLRDCEVCHKLAAYVYLPKLTKACDKCISVDKRFVTVTLASFAKEAGWTTARLRKQLSVVKTVSGDYRGWGVVRIRPVDMVNFAEALKVANDVTKSIRPKFGDQSSGIFIRRMVTAPLPFFNKETQKTEPILTCKGCACRWQKAFDGVQTQQNYHQNLWRLLPDHSRSGLLAHFADCTSAKMLWAASDDGTKSTWRFDGNFIRAGAVKKELRMGMWTGVDRY
jgi:hypothetical protein